MSERVCEKCGAPGEFIQPTAGYWVHADHATRRSYDSHDFVPRNAPARSMPFEWLPNHPEPGEWYQHIKGGVYRVVARASIEPTLEPCIVYVHHDDGNDGRVWVRPLSEFTDGRFQPWEAPF